MYRRKCKFRAKLGWVLVCMLLSATARGETFEDGRSAYLAGDYPKAFSIWETLAASTDRRAQFGLGTLYHEGAGVRRDPLEANRWFRLSAEQGYAPAQFNLGNAFRRGDGVQQSDEEASKWWKKAADQGFAPAQYNLGTQHYFGRGVSRDPAMAMRYYRRAADNGHRGAKDLLTQLARLAGAEAAPATEAAEPVVEATAHTEPADPVPVDRSAPGDPPAGEGDHGWGWVAAQAPEHYTLQLVSVSSDAAARSFIDRERWSQPIQVIPLSYGQKSLHSVLLGVYENRAAAQAAIADLPEKVSRLKPWVRRFGALQALAPTE